MKNIFNKANVLPLVSGSISAISLPVLGVFAAAPYIAFLAPVAALGLGLPFVIGGAIFSIATFALSSIVISKNNTISEKEAQLAGKDTEISNLKKKLAGDGDISCDATDIKKKFGSRVAARKDAEAEERAKNIEELKKTGIASENGAIALPYEKAETSSPADQPAEENGQSWTTWGLDKAKTAVGTAIFAAAAAPNLVGTLFTGSNVSPVGGMFNDINGTCSRY